MVSREFGDLNALFFMHSWVHRRVSEMPSKTRNRKERDHQGVVSGETQERGGPVYTSTGDLKAGQDMPL